LCAVSRKNGTRKCRKNYEGQVSKYMEQKRGRRASPA